LRPSMAEPVSHTGKRLQATSLKGPSQRRPSPVLKNARQLQRLPKQGVWCAYNLVVKHRSQCTDHSRSAASLAICRHQGLSINVCQTPARAPDIEILGAPSAGCLTRHLTRSISLMDKRFLLFMDCRSCLTVWDGMITPITVLRTDLRRSPESSSLRIRRDSTIRNLT